ncbi:helix-turn-helix transcriptional regulator [Ramlibacter sp. AN1133]|uniref:helix-turn-helix transcriptional regulator n=1 Tax=Ramlibacter sp. AN1133 TaxID=3133429 RepID=UPI0030C0263B
MPDRNLSAPTDPTLLDVIHSIHAAARDPSLWPGVLGKVLAIVGKYACRPSPEVPDAHLLVEAVEWRLQELHAVTHAALQALERLNYGVLLLGPDGELRHANRRAQDISRRTRAYSVSATGRLQASASALSTRLHKAVQGAAQGSGTRDMAGTPLRLRGVSGADVHAFVVPVPAGTQHLEKAVVAMMFVADPESTLPNFPEKLRQIYHLSPTEAQLAEALVNGRSLKQFAVERGTSLNTVRTQLRSLAAKVGAKRQLDVVRCILTGPAVLDL